MHFIGVYWAIVKLILIKKWEVNLKLQGAQALKIWETLKDLTALSLYGDFSDKGLPAIRFLREKKAPKQQMPHTCCTADE